jgi:hypothetical protein
MSMSVTVTGANRRLNFDWPRAAASWAADVAPDATWAIKVAAPVSKPAAPPAARPGALRDSVASRTESEAGVMTITVFSTVPYAGYVIGGTAPHKIAARNAKALRWTDGSGLHFARSVNHPGTKPNPFPERALSLIQTDIAAKFASAAQEAIVID